MAMPTLSQIRAGIVTRLQTITGLHAYPNWPNHCDFPAAIVTLTGEGEATMSIGYTLKGRVIVLSGPAEVDYSGMQTALDTYLDVAGASNANIWEAIEADKTLGGLACRINVTGWDSYSANWQVNQGEAFGAALNFEVWR